MNWLLITVFWPLMFQRKQASNFMSQHKQKFDVTFFTLLRRYWVILRDRKLPCKACDDRSLSHNYCDKEIVMKREAESRDDFSALLELNRFLMIVIGDCRVIFVVLQANELSQIEFVDAWSHLHSRNDHSADSTTVYSQESFSEVFLSFWKQINHLITFKFCSVDVRVLKHQEVVLCKVFSCFISWVLPL